MTSPDPRVQRLITDCNAAIAHADAAGTDAWAVDEMRRAVALVAEMVNSRTAAEQSARTIAGLRREAQSYRERLKIAEAELGTRSKQQ